MDTSTIDQGPSTHGSRPSPEAPEQPRRVLHVTQAYGGVATHLRHLISNGGAGIRFGLAVPTDGSLARWARDRGCDVYLVPMNRSIGPHDVVAFGRLIAAIRAFRPDVLHVHSSKAGALGRVAGWFCGVPVRLYTANAYAFLGARGAKRVALRALERLAGWFGTGTIAVSPSEGAAAQALSRRPIWIVANGIPHAPPRARNDAGPPWRVGTIGRLCPQKRSLLFVRAMERVAARRADVSFVLLGGGDGTEWGAYERSVRATIAASPHRGRFSLIGWVADPLAELAGLSVVVFTSAYEGLPFALLEAWQQGVPVVTVDAPGLGEVVRNGSDGVVVPSDEPEAIAAAVDAVLSNRGEAQRLAAGAAERLRRDHDAARMARRYEEVYAEALAATGRVRS